MTSPAARLFARGSWPETSRIAAVLRKETVGGVLLLVGTVIALVWANSPWSAGYEALRDAEVGPAALHLHLSLGAWASDGLLAIFFFVAGLELKREFVAGDLRDPRRAALPVAAAVGGMAVPALIYVLVNLGAGAAARLGDPDRHRHRVRPRRPRGDQHPPAERAAHLPADPRRRRRPAGHHDHRDLLHSRRSRSGSSRSRWCRSRCSACWCSGGSGRRGCCSRSLRSRGRSCTPRACTPPSPGCCSPSRCRSLPASPGDARTGRAFEHRFRPISAGVAVPVFAFFAAGVTVGGLSGLTDSLTDTIALGHRRRPGRRQGHRHHRGHLAGRPVHPRPARRRPGLVGRRRPGAARRHRVHRLAADRRARLRRRAARGTTTPRWACWSAR